MGRTGERERDLQGLFGGPGQPKWNYDLNFNFLLIPAEDLFCTCFFHSLF